MAICSKCKQEKADSEFGYNKTKRRINKVNFTVGGINIGNTIKIRQGKESEKLGNGITNIRKELSVKSAGKVILLARNFITLIQRRKTQKLQIP